MAIDPQYLPIDIILQDIAVQDSLRRQQLAQMDMAQRQLYEKGYQSLYEQAYRELCEAITGKLPTEEPPPEEDFIKLVVKYFNDNKEELHQKICVNFNFCAKKNEWGSTASFIDELIALSSVLIDTVSHYCGIASATWLISRSLLEIFCKCSSK